MIQVWLEDDATLGLEGHEYVNQAYERITGETYDKSKALGTHEFGEGTYVSMPGKYMVLESYAGNNAIYEKDNLP